MTTKEFMNTPLSQLGPYLPVGTAKKCKERLNVEYLPELTQVDYYTARNAVGRGMTLDWLCNLLAICRLNWKPRDLYFFDNTIE